MAAKKKLPKPASIYFAIFSHKLQTYVMQWQVTRKSQSLTSWRPIINRTVVNITSQKYTMKHTQKLTDREQDRERQEA